MSKKIICQNKKVYYDYFIEETFEAGIVLQGTEVKSLREGRASLGDAFAIIRNDEAYLLNLHISPYTRGDIFTQPDPTRRRKLLMHKKEIEKLVSKVKEKGCTLVVTKLYFKRGRAKVELALGKGKKHYDKRETIKKRTVARELSKEFKATKIKV